MWDDPMSWSYGQTTINRHDPRKGGWVESKTARLGPAPDAHSDADGHSNCKWSGPAPPAGNRGQSEAVAGRPWEVRPGHRQPKIYVKKVDDMNESTRTSGPSDSGTPATAVKITPATQSGDPVTTTRTAA